MTIAEIYESVAGLGHSENVLLDPQYSPGTTMPVVDFSPIVKDLVLEGDWATLHQFVLELSEDKAVADATIRTFKPLNIRDYIEGGDELLAEIVALMILTRRIEPFRSDSHDDVLVAFLKNTLCCTRARFAGAAKGKLLNRLTEDLAKLRQELSRTDLPIPTLADLDEIDTAPPDDELVARIAAIPVTSRAVIFDTLERDWGHSTIKTVRPELYYGERQFGNNAAWNQHYVEWVGVFVRPSPDTDITKLLSKELIRDEASKSGVEIPKSYSRGKMLTRIRERDAVTYMRLFEEATKDSAEIDPAHEPALSELMDRRRRIDYACRAIAAI